MYFFTSEIYNNELQYSPRDDFKIKNNISKTSLSKMSNVSKLLWYKHCDTLKASINNKTIKYETNDNNSKNKCNNTFMNKCKIKRITGIFISNKTKM